MTHKPNPYHFNTTTATVEGCNIETQLRQSDNMALQEETDTGRSSRIMMSLYENQLKMIESDSS